MTITTRHPRKLLAIAALSSSSLLVGVGELAAGAPGPAATPQGSSNTAKAEPKASPARAATPAADATPEPASECKAGPGRGAACRCTERARDARRGEPSRADARLIASDPLGALSPTAPSRTGRAETSADPEP